MVNLTPLQSVQIFGWMSPRSILTWDDVLRLRLSFDALLGHGMRVSELILIQPDPSQWVAHGGVGLSHARSMTLWPANPFVHMGADLGDVLAQKYSAEELVSMGVDYAQLVKYGLTAQTERMFKFSSYEWSLLGRRPVSNES